jgi:hypothetical protein
MELGEFLRRELSNGSAWNCSTVVADWCLARGHPDFAAGLRGLVDPDECATAASDAGGLAPLWDRCFSGALPVVTNLEPGDVAVLSALGLEAGGIWTGQRWAVKAPRGLHFLDPAVLLVVKAWRP